MNDYYVKIQSYTFSYHGGATKGAGYSVQGFRPDGTPATHDYREYDQKSAVARAARILELMGREPIKIGKGKAGMSPLN